MKAVAKTLRITPKKLNLIAELVRDKNAVEAMDMLQFLPKKGAKMLNKVVSSAVANAKNNFKQDEKSLYIKEIVVSKAPTYKRWLPASRGRTQPILKRNSHVSVTIAVREETPKKKTTKKAPGAPKGSSPATKKAAPKKTEAKAAPKAAKPAAKKEEKAPKATATPQATKTPQQEPDKA